MFARQTVARPPKTDLKAFAFGALTIAIFAAAVILHFRSGLTFPVPWGDEAHYVWQARAFERWHSFVAPELDPARPLLLLPFVYQGTLGIAFALFGYSFELARLISFLFILAGIGFLIAVVWRHTYAVLALAVIAPFLLNKYFVLIGNVARMDAFLFAVVCGVLLLMQRGLIWEALTLLSLSPMIHPNGIYFLLPAAIYAVWAWRLFSQPISKAAIAMFAATIVIWLAHGIYVLAYWDGFVHDLAYRIGDMHNRRASASALSGWAIAELALIAAGALLCWHYRVSAGYLLALALGAWLANFMLLEQWYEPFRDLSWILVTLAFMEIVPEAIGTEFGKKIAFLAVAAIVAMSIILGIVRGRVQRPRFNLANIYAFGMHMAPSDGAAYFTPEDHDRIGTYIASFSPTCHIWVETYPWGDGLLLGDLEGEHARFQVPYFDVLFRPEERAWGYQPAVAPVPDLYLIHVSRYHPAYLLDRQNQFIARAAERSGSPPAVIRARDGSEAWYAIVPTRTAKATRTVSDGWRNCPD